MVQQHPHCGSDPEAQAIVRVLARERHVRMPQQIDRLSRLEWLCRPGPGKESGARTFVRNLKAGHSPEAATTGARRELDRKAECAAHEAGLAPLRGPARATRGPLHLHTAHASGW